MDIPLKRVLTLQHTFQWDVQEVRLMKPSPYDYIILNGTAMENATAQPLAVEDAPEQDCPKDMPAVFQCQRCNLIISDSTAFVAAHDELKSITLDRVNSSVELSTKLITSTDGIDQGSTFGPLLCQGCKTVLGKVYRTTPRPLDDLRDFYTFNVNKLSVYQVGSSSSSALSDSESPLQQYTNLKTLKETIVKLQVLMCAMHQRILNIEQSLEIEETDGPENPLQFVAGLVGQSNTSGSPSAAHHPSKDTGTGATKSQSAALQQNGGKGPDILSQSKDRQDIEGYPMRDVRRSGAFERASSNHQTSSDSESSGVSTFTSKVTRKGRGSSSKATVGRGGRDKGKEKDSDLNRIRGTKRTQDFDEVMGDPKKLEHGLESLSPIRKKSSTRANKPV